MSIKVNHISKLYGAQKALDDVSFEAGSGQVVGFLGPNGAGKSTMMKIITCFIPQTSGSAAVCGFDVTEDSIEVRKNVGYLPEHNPLYLEMYVKEYLDFVCGVYHLNGNRKKRIEELVEMTGLQVEQKKKIGALSKGYRQRVGLAQAMIHDPKVLILDEPTSGLDPNQLSEIRTLIKNIGKEKTVMLSTHIMQEVEAICDRVIIINKGKIVADETTEFLQQKSGVENIIVVEFDKSIDKNLLQQIQGAKKVQHLKENSWRISSDKNTDIRPAVFNFAVANQLTVLSLHKEEQSIEDVFQQLTKEVKA
jgi:ABC-2 type transport system ATP-binding protein